MYHRESGQRIYGGEYWLASLAKLVLAGECSPGEGGPSDDCKSEAVLEYRQIISLSLV